MAASGFFTTTAGLVTALLLSGSAMAQEVSLRFQSSDPAGNPNFELMQGWGELVGEMSGGRIAIEVVPVGALVEHSETQDAVASGILDGHMTDPSYFSGRDPAFGLIANPVGAWSNPEDMLRFMQYGGGRDLMREIEKDYGLYFIGAATPGLEALVSKVPLDGVADLKGLKLRAPEGLVQAVFAAAGAAPVNLPGSEVFTSLDKGVIDAADYTVFSTNQAQGLNDIAPHPVYPGFHSLPMIEVSMNLAKWEALPEDLQKIMEVSVDQFSRDMLAALRDKDMAAVATARGDSRMTIHDWPQEERAAFRAIAVSQWEKVAAGSANAGKVFDLLTGYLSAQGMLVD
ncbi:TRAP transporter substrate-binding protein [Arenibacterium sp. LLYu02]|uniref:TRAP transporter substrate-binding protein n=1 Tax=Arenibacterium sp. LLYu02 TaxID=3404132 RepID=UPI003B20F55E